MKDMIIALAGNPNSGKTTLFNQLTGANQQTANFPGVTVEKKSGKLKGFEKVSVVDLPGIYSVRPYSMEEIVAVDFLLNEKPDCIVNIIDVTNIERGLYLTLQLIEFGVPIILVLNMADELERNNGKVNVKILSKNLGIPVVLISATKNAGINNLKELIKTKKEPEKTRLYQGTFLNHINLIKNIIQDNVKISGIPPNLALSAIIMKNHRIADIINLSQKQLNSIEKILSETENKLNLERNEALANSRYDFIESVCSKSINKGSDNRQYLLSQKIDSVLMNKFLAFPLFLIFMFSMFLLTFNVIGAYLSRLLESFIGYLIEIAENALIFAKVNDFTNSLITNGILNGIGSVLKFLPIIITLFFFLSILENSGYLARVAVIMDKPFRKIGLSGRSFIPLLLGFGCTVPAIMATRTLSSDRERKITAIMTPFMSCSAKIPIYGIFVSAFFPDNKLGVIISLYIIGIVMAVLTAALSNYNRKDEYVPFMIELPNYRIPSIKSVLILMWEKSKEFIQKAFTIIFLSSVLIWFLQSFNLNLNYISDNENSILAHIGKFLTPIFKPLGFSDWRIPTALISGLTAKESVISSLSILMGADIQENPLILANLFTVKSAFRFLIFTLFYSPCFAAIAAIKKEFGKWSILVVLGQCALAWFLAFLLSF